MSRFWRISHRNTFPLPRERSYIWTDVLPIFTSVTGLGRQKQYLMAFVEKAKEEFARDITLPVRLFQAAAPSMVTDLTADEVMYLASEAAKYSFSEDDLIILPGVTDTSGEFDEFYVDQDALKQLIIDVFYTEVEGI